jgi:hypothetical protein
MREGRILRDLSNGSKYEPLLRQPILAISGWLLPIHGGEMSHQEVCLEDQLFDYEDGMMNIIEEGIYSFENVVLKVRIGDQDFLAGKVFAYALFDTCKSTVEFFDKPEDEPGQGYKYALKLSIGEKLP